MEADLIAKLLATAGITALAGARINWMRRTQGQTIPADKAAIVLHLIDAPREYRVDGAAGLIVSRVQVDCWAHSFKAAKAAARAVDAGLSGQRFTQGATRFAGVLTLDEGDDTFDEPPLTYFRTRLDLAVHHAPAS